MDENHKIFFEFMRKLKKFFVPYKYKKKVRIGEGGDGGYVIADIPCEYCYSYGCDDNILFEKGLYENYGTHSYTYDHTIQGITNKPDYITFKREGIAFMKTHDCDTLESHVSGHDHSSKKILKMDVEFAEWAVFHSTKIEILEKFDQIVVEFHFYMLEDSMLEVMEKLTSKFKIIHMHANPYPINPYIDIEFPKVIEVTFLRDDLFTDDELEVDMESVFPDPDLDPVYPIQFPELKWWKRPYDTFNAVSLTHSNVNSLNDSSG